MSELDRLVWAVKRSYAIGDGLFAVRSTSEAFGTWLDGALARYRTDQDALTRYSVVIADEPDEVTKERFHILYQGTTALVKTTSLDELVRMLFLDLETFEFPSRDDALYADMVTVSKNGVTALVPEVLMPFIGTLGLRRVARAGLRLPMETAVAIDPVAAEVTPIRPRVEAELASLDTLTGVPSTGGMSSRVALERPTHVDVLVSIGWGDELIQPVSKGLALYRLASHVANLPLFEDGALSGLKRLTEEARCYEMGAKKPAEMLQALLVSLERA
jgi:hypothetical protein